MTLLYIATTLLTIFCTYLVYKLIKQIRCYMHMRSLPGPPIHGFLTGTTIPDYESESDFGTRFYFRKEWSTKLPKLCRFASGPIINLLASHPDSVKTIITENYSKGKIYSFLYNWIGDGLLTSKGEKWFRHRKLLTPAFHYEILNEFFPVYSDCVDEMLELWSTQLANTGHVVLQDWMSYLTLDILLQCICSVKTYCQVKREELQYVKDIATLTQCIFIRSKYPQKYYFNFFFNRTQLGRDFNTACKGAKQFTYDIILQRKLAIREGVDNREGKYRDFLDILLHATDPKTGATLTDEEIRDEVDTFVFEGHDTTATALTWTLYLLAKHTEYQDICRQEVFEISSGKSLTKTSIASLSFLPMCIKESLRMYPPVTSVVRTTKESSRLSGHTLPSGYLMVIGINHLHNNIHVWDNPSKFDPYRFSKENIDKIDPFSYIPFSAGSRNCIGQNMAMHELNYVIARILTRFYLTLPKDFPEEMEYESSILLKPKHPIKMLLSSI